MCISHFHKWIIISLWARNIFCNFFVSNSSWHHKYQLDDLMFCFLLCPWELNRHLWLANNYTLSQIYSAPPHINFMLLFLKFPAATTSTLLALSICPCSYITEKIGIPHFHYYILQPPIIVPSILPSFLLLWISYLHYQTIHFTMN